MPRALALLVALACAAYCWAGQASAQLRLPGGDGEVSVVADRMEEREGVLLAIGNVEISRGGARLLADRVEIRRATGEAVATGRVIFYDGEDRLSGERIEYNLRSGTGVVHQAEVFSAPYYRLRGDQIERAGESLYKIRGAMFTTCEDDPPAWSFHAQSVTVDLDDQVFGRNAAFWVKGVPVFPFIPFFAAAIRRERQTGFLTPTAGSSSRKGLFAKVPFFWAISDSQDLTVSLDAYSERGIGANAEYRYVLSRDQQGALSGFGIHEAFRDGEFRAYGGVKHSWAIDPTLTFKADVNVVNDDRVFRVYGDRLHERSLQRAESNVFVTKRWQQWNFVGNVLWYQDLTTSRGVELQRVPDLRAQSLRYPVPGLPGFLYEVEASFTNFLRDEGSDGIRFDLHPRIFRPISAAGYFTFTPFLGARGTFYNVRVIGDRELRDGTRIELTEEVGRVRTIGEFGADVETRASRVYGWNGRWNVDRVQHVVEPRVNYTRAIAMNASATPRWDPIDEEGDRNRVTVSLTNRLLARTISAENAVSERWELARFTLSEYYDIDVPATRLGPLRADLILAPSRAFQVRADVEQDLGGRGLRSFSGDAAVFLENAAAALGARFNDVDKIEFLRGQLSTRVTRNIGLRGDLNWDVRENAIVEHRIGFDLRFQCWAFSFTYIGRREDEDEVRFSLNLLGVGQLGTRTGVGF